MKDAVHKLSRGKSSGKKIGNRNVRHRLREDEREKFEIAKKRGYLLVHKTTRKALLNTWYLWCEACKVEAKIRKKNIDGTESEEMIYFVSHEKLQKD